MLAQVGWQAGLRSLIYLILPSGGISELNSAAGQASDEALRSAVTMGLAVFLFSMLFLLLALRYLRHDEESRLSRARALGEADV